MPETDSFIEVEQGSCRTLLHVLSAPLSAILCGAGVGFLFVLLMFKFSPLVGLCLLLSMGVAAAVFYNPQLGFLITAAVIPLERFGRFTDDTSSFTISLMRLLGFLAMAALALHVLLKKEWLRFDLSLALYSFYSAICFFSLFYSSDFMGSLRAFGQIASNLAFFFLVINLVKDFSLAKTGIILWLAVTVFISAYTAYDWHSGAVTVGTEAAIGSVQDRFVTVWIDSTEWESGLGGIKRAMGSTSHAAVYGINLILTLPFFIFFLKGRYHPAIKVIIFLSFLLIFYNILLTNTRAVLLVAVLTVLLCIVRKLLIIRPPVLLAFILASIAALWWVDFSIFERIVNLKNYSYSESRTLRIRMAYWDAGSRIFADNWLIGIGVGNKNEVPKYIKGRVPDRTTVHNEYLQTLMEVGVVGGGLFFSFLIVLLYYSFKSGKRFELYESESEMAWFMVACQIAMVVSLIYALQCDLFRFPLKGWWLIAGVTVVMMKIANQLETSRDAISTGADHG